MTVRGGTVAAFTAAALTTAVLLPSVLSAPECRTLPAPAPGTLDYTPALDPARTPYGVWTVRTYDPGATPEIYGYAAEEDSAVLSDPGCLR